MIPFGYILEPILFLLIFIVATQLKMGRKWSVCGNGCARKKGHEGPHSYNATVDPTYRPKSQLVGEIGAIQSKLKADPERMSLLLDSYLKNRPNHKKAARQLLELERDRARSKLGLM